MLAAHFDRLSVNGGVDLFTTSLNTKNDCFCIGCA